MLFNSLEFLLFLPIVFAIYWGVLNKTVKGQNVFLLIASYVFYGWWDYRFLALIAFSTIVDFVIARFMASSKSDQKRKILLSISLFVNLGLLGFFKYYNFFIESWIDAWAEIGITMHASSLNIILPVGISFYTFQTLSYTIDVYRKKLEPTYNLINFAAYVSFFPQLVAGPIERATHLLPQFKNKRTFNSERAISGGSNAEALTLMQMFVKNKVIINEVFHQLDYRYNSFGLSNGFKHSLVPYAFDSEIRILGNKIENDFAYFNVPFYRFLKNGEPYGLKSLLRVIKHKNESKKSFFKFKPHLTIGDTVRGTLPVKLLEKINEVDLINLLWQAENKTVHFFSAPICPKIENRNTLKILKSRVLNYKSYLYIFDFELSNYYDCVHLNKDGAEKFTKRLINDYNL